MIETTNVFRKIEMWADGEVRLHYHVRVTDTETPDSEQLIPEQLTISPEDSITEWPQDVQNIITSMRQAQGA